MAFRSKHWKFDFSSAPSRSTKQKSFAKPPGFDCDIIEGDAADASAVVSADKEKLAKQRQMMGLAYSPVCVCSLTDLVMM